MQNSIIVAQATSPGLAGIAIVRLSGTEADIRQILPSLVTTSINKIKPRLATFTHFKDIKGQNIDEGIMIYFPAPHSYTGETVLELQCHGGVIVPGMIIETCIGLGCELAGPGAFSIRAVLNGKMTTLKAEAISGLIHADNEAQARAALRSMRGEFANYIGEIEKEIKHYRIMIESSIDFDDEDISPDLSITQLKSITDKIDNLYELTNRAVSDNRDQEVCLIGEPNAGKSSWLNHLLADDVAIVDSKAGTTRDLIEKRLLIKNKWVQITDTAGLRLAKNTVEKEGVKRAQEKLELVDLVIWVVDIDKLSDLSERAKLLPEKITMDPKRLLILWNKKDTHQLDEDQFIWQKHTVYSVSAKEDSDAVKVVTLIADKLIQPCSNGFYARKRHLVAISHINRLAKKAIAEAEKTMDIVLMAERMREIQLELDNLVGLFSTEDLLGEIFGSFCIGK